MNDVERIKWNLRPLQKITLLYVEDDNDSREQFSKYLKRYIVKELFVAKDGKEGLELFMENNPDLILTDILMPKMTGLEMIERIRKDGYSTPVVVLSAHDEMDKVMSALYLGVCRYVMKPVQTADLFQALLDCSKVCDTGKGGRHG